MECESLNYSCKILLNNEKNYYVIYNKSNSKYNVCKNCLSDFKKILIKYNNYKKCFTIINEISLKNI